MEIMINEELQAKIFNKKYCDKLVNLKDLNKAKFSTFSSNKDNEIWYAFNHLHTKIPAQGWKIHLSFNAKDALEVVNTILPELIKEELTFKIVKNLYCFKALNSGEYGVTQIGKVITIYPSTFATFNKTIEFLKVFINLKAGPPITTDLRISNTSSIFIRYGVMNPVNYIVDENSTKKYLLKNKNGVLVEDNRSTISKQPSWAPKLKFETIRGSFFYEHDFTNTSTTFIPMTSIYHSPKGSLNLGLSIEDGGLVLQKRIYALVGGAINGKDARILIQNEFKILQKLSNKVTVPKAYSIIENELTSEMYYEFLDGKNFEQLPNSIRKEQLHNVASELSKLHRLGYAHMDIKLPNVFWANEKVYLTDFEYTSKIGIKKNFVGGTRGYYKSTNEEYITLNNDYYAFAICICNIYLNIENSQLLLSINSLKQLLNLYGLHKISTIVNKLTSKTVTIETLVLQSKNIIEIQNTEPAINNKHCCNIYLKYVDFEKNTLLLLNKIKQKNIVGGWESLHSTKNCIGINTGTSGLVIGLCLFSPIRTKLKENLIKHGCDFLVKQSLTDYSNGFFSGKMGVAFALVLAGSIINDKRILNKGLEIVEQTSIVYKSSDFFNGLAGSLFALSTMYSISPNKIFKIKAIELARNIIQRKEITNTVTVWNDNDKYLTGAAHGVFGIVVSLLLYSKVFKNNEIKKIGISIVKEHFEFIYVNNNLPNDYKVLSSSTPITSWCHGYEGILWSLLFNIEYVDIFTTEIDYCVNKLKEIHPIENGSLCHGLAGKLEIWRMLGNIAKYKELAKAKELEVLSVLYLTKRKYKSYYSWFSDEAPKFSPDLWTGFMGTHVAVQNCLSKNNFSFLSNNWLLKCIN